MGFVIGERIMMFIVLAVSLAVMAYALRGLSRSSRWSGQRGVDALIVFYTLILLALGGMLAVSPGALARC
jgi:heme A synthase